MWVSRLAPPQLKGLSPVVLQTARNKCKGLSLAGKNAVFATSPLGVPAEFCLRPSSSNSWPTVWAEYVPEEDGEFSLLDVPASVLPQSQEKGALDPGRGATSSHISRHLVPIGRTRSCRKIIKGIRKRSRSDLRLHWNCCKRALDSGGPVPGGLA